MGPNSAVDGSDLDDTQRHAACAAHLADLRRFCAGPYPDIRLAAAAPRLFPDAIRPGFSAGAAMIGAALMGTVHEGFDKADARRTGETPIMPAVAHVR